MVKKQETLSFHLSVSSDIKILDYTIPPAVRDLSDEGHTGTWLTYFCTYLHLPQISEKSK